MLTGYPVYAENFEMVTEVCGMCVGIHFIPILSPTSEESNQICRKEEKSPDLTHIITIDTQMEKSLNVAVHNKIFDCLGAAILWNFI